MVHTNGASAEAPRWTLGDVFTAQLTMLSDWHVGTGTGRPGSVDRLVARDRSGLPYVPAKTLIGMWRDALERLTFALDDGQRDGAWSQWVDVLFGSQPANAPGGVTTPPRPAALMVRPARMSRALRASLASDEQIRQALTFVKPGVAIDSQRGQAVPRALRFEEMARLGTQLYADCSLALNPGDRMVASALLLAGARLVEGLGGKRRRGAGKCRLTIVAHDEEPALHWLQTCGKAPERPELVKRWGISAALSEVQPQELSTWLRLPLTLTLETPLAVAANTLGNVTESLDYVPGTLLLPHVTRKLQSLGDQTCGAAIAAGLLQVLPAMIGVEGTRALPVPSMLWKEKEGRQVRNRLKESVNGTTQFKAMGDYIVSVADKALLKAVKTPLDLLTHNTVDDGPQRPTSEVGGVYSRQVIAAGTVLYSELRLRQDVAGDLQCRLGTWWTALQGEVRLGVSRKDDYGLVSLEVQGAPKPFDHQPQVDPEQPERLTVWLLSDVLLRGGTLRGTTETARLQRELETRLGIQELKLAEVGNELCNAMIRTHRVESWHRGWGLPRPSLVAMQAGSCAVFEVVEGELQSERLQEVETSGIGERRAEGYGQVGLNTQLLSQPLGDWSVYEQRKPDLAVNAAQSADELTEDERAYARRIEMAAWREALQRVVLGLAASPEERRRLLGIEWQVSGNGVAQSAPPMSQLGSLRTAISGLQTPADAPAVLQWLNHLQANANRSNKWPGPALSRIVQLVSDPEHVWRVLGEAWQAPPVLPGRTMEEMRRAMWAEAVRGLVDACGRAHKRDVEHRAGEEDEHGA